MQDRQLYEQILGISHPWHVARVELQLEDGEIQVFLEHDSEAAWSCPECGAACVIHDHAPERRWRHLDTCQYRTVLHAAVPRVRCPEHGVLVARVSWAERHSRFTSLFERLAIDWLRVADQSSVGRLLGLSWDEVHGIMERAVERGLSRRRADVSAYIGIDETSYQKRHRYVTVVTDAKESKVLYVAEGRSKASLDGFWGTLTEEQLTSIGAAAMDMWDPFESSVREHVPHAEIVYDKFHIAKLLNEAVDQVRRSENKALRAAGDDRLVRTRYKWLTNPDRMTDEQWLAFRDLRKSTLKTARAWGLKEFLMMLWSYRYESWARRYFTEWYNWAVRSKLPPMVKLARSLKRRLDSILSYLKHPITTARNEGLNAKIQWVKYTARGFRSMKNFIIAIYFHCGGLDLSPA